MRGDPFMYAQVKGGILKYIFSGGGEPTNFKLLLDIDTMLFPGFSSKTVSHQKERWSILM